MQVKDDWRSLSLQLADHIHLILSFLALARYHRTVRLQLMRKGAEWADIVTSIMLALLADLLHSSCLEHQ